MLDDSILRIAFQGFAVALTAALIVMPACIQLARRLEVVDRPGGRKTHRRVTPLLGGVGVVTAATVAFLVVSWRLRSEVGTDLGFPQIGFILAGSLVLFAIGLLDDIFKDSMGFQPKLLGQVTGVMVLMWPSLRGFVEDPGGAAEVLYLLFFMGWYLTIVNSFNFSDNMNGLMSGLSVIAFGASILYLQHTSSVRTMMVALILMGAVLGFMPYNFPRARIFLGDAGTMFIGFWMAWIQFDLIKGFMGRPAALDVHELVPAVLVMGVPLYDAAFVVFMRAYDRRPLYLGDNHHLSHRLVRGGFTPAEAVIFLWGLGLILAGLGVLAARAQPLYCYLIFGAALLFMVAVTRTIMTLERSHRGPQSPEGGESFVRRREASRPAPAGEEGG